MITREKIIENYIRSYNAFDTTAMVKDFDPSIEFENISDGETNMSLKGLESFIKQADLAKTYFSKRNQVIKSFKQRGEETEIEVDYTGILAMDLPNGLKKGEELKLNGKSIFRFRGDKIIKLTDIS